MSGGDASKGPNDGPVGIGGWLVLPLLGLVVTVLGSYRMLGQYAGLSEMLARLSPSQSAFVIFEVVGNAVLLVFPILLLALAFQTKRSFPGLYVVWAVAGMAFLVVDLILAMALFPAGYPTVESLFDEATVRELLRSLLLLVVWAPYMMKSRRVANTFVN